MQDNTNWTPDSEENLLGLTDKNLINEHEATGLIKAEIYVFTLDANLEISNSFNIRNSSNSI
ncbi:MAG: cell filamentation protein [Spirosomataceae bacterium]|jgi:cell filamentation protein